MKRRNERLWIWKLSVFGGYWRLLWDLDESGPTLLGLLITVLLLWTITALRRGRGANESALDRSRCKPRCKTVLSSTAVLLEMLDMIFAPSLTAVRCKDDWTTKRALLWFTWKVVKNWRGGQQCYSQKLFKPVQQNLNKVWHRQTECLFLLLFFFFR